jgi:flagellar M-ring protein FliF
MPSSGRMGFELFDRTAFGVTDFLEHVNYRRALEGELARTISTISEVAGARVHIALPQPSLFVGREQPTKHQWC